MGFTGHSGIYNLIFLFFFRQPAENILGWDFHNSFTAFLKEENTSLPGNIGEESSHSITIYICLAMYGVWR